MESLGETPEVLGPAPSKYGSWLKVSPAPRAGGVPASFLAICASICAHTMTTDAVGKTAAPAVLTLFEKERPKAATVKDWLKDAKPSFSASERALLENRTPRSIMVYDHNTVPAELTASEHTTGATVAQREVQRQAVIDANDAKTRQKKEHLAELRENIFLSLQAALKPNAPTLLNTLEASCR